MSDASIQHKRPHTGQCFDDGGTACGSTEFPFDLIDANLAAELVKNSAQADPTQKSGEGQPGELSITREELDEMLGKARMEGGRKMLKFIITGGNLSSKSIGNRTLVSAHILKAGGVTSQRELAKRMRVTSGRVSQIAKGLRHHLDFLNSTLMHGGKAGVR